MVYECAYGKFHASTVGRMSAGNGQQAAKEGTFHVVAVWFHCLHNSEMHDAARNGLTVKADFFNNSYEMRPSPETFVGFPAVVYVVSSRLALSRQSSM